jgi:hypothetical protein
MNSGPVLIHSVQAHVLLGVNLGFIEMYLIINKGCKDARNPHPMENKLKEPAGCGGEDHLLSSDVTYPFSQGTPMKSSKSNTKISVAQEIFFE